MLFRGILFILSFFAAAFIIGNAVLKFIGWRRSFCASYVWGFVIMLAVFQLAAYPMFRLSTSFMLLFWTYSGLLTAMLCLSLPSLFSSNSERPYTSQLKEIREGCRKYPFLMIILITAISFSLFMSLGFYYSSSDDGYYITRSMETVLQNRLNVSEILAWQGRDVGIPDYKDCSTFVFFIAYLSKISGIQATILSKTFFLFNLLIAHFAAVASAADSIFENRENLLQKKALFMTLYLVFQTLAVKEGSAGTWMTGYLWEGKAVLIAVIFPLMLSACMNLYRRIELFESKEWIALLALVLAGIELSVIGVFLPVILFFSFGTAIILCGGFKYFKRLWKPVLITVLPIVLFAGLSYYSVVNVTGLLNRGSISSATADTVSGTISGSSRITLLFSSWMTQFWSAADFWQYVLYSLSVLYILIKGSKIQRVLLCFAPAVLILTFLNPLLSDFVSKYVTTPIVYWRLFWLFPIYLLPSAVITEICSRLTNGELQKGLVISLLSFGLIAGFEVFRYSVTSAEYSFIPFAKNIGKLINIRPELRFNIYNLNPAPMGAAEMIEVDWDGVERPSVLFCFNRPYEMRLYSPEIELTSQARNNYEAKRHIPGTDIIESEFISSYSEITDGEYLRTILDKMNVDYICFDVKSASDDLEENGFEHIGNSCGIIDIWKVVQN